MPHWFSYTSSLLTKKPVPLDTHQQLSAKGSVATFGPEIGLARQLWADKQLPVTIVKCAWGGTDLAQAWNPSSKNLFVGMVSEVTGTMTNDAKTGQLDTIGGFYWYQGEADAGTPAWAAAYQDNLTNFISAVRGTLPMSATAPFGIIKESSAGWITVSRGMGLCGVDNCAAYILGDNEVRAADDWAAANIPNVFTVDSFDAPRHGVQIHLSNIGELTVGQRIAVATENFIP